MSVAILTMGSRLPWLFPAMSCTIPKTDLPGGIPVPPSWESLDILMVVDILLSRETTQRKLSILGMGMGEKQRRAGG